MVCIIAHRPQVTGVHVLPLHRNSTSCIDHLLKQRRPYHYTTTWKGSGRVIHPIHLTIVRPPLPRLKVLYKVDLQTFHYDQLSRATSSKTVTYAATTPPPVILNAVKDLRCFPYRCAEPSVPGFHCSTASLLTFLRSFTTFRMTGGAGFKYPPLDTITDLSYMDVIHPLFPLTSIHIRARSASTIVGCSMAACGRGTHPQHSNTRYRANLLLLVPHFA